MRRGAENLLVATFVLAGAACGYPDPGTGSGAPIASTVVATAPPSPGIDNFSDGAGLPTVKFLDGLAYVDLKVGDGPVVGKGDKVSVQYTGWLGSTGAKFDSSRDRGTPFDVTIGVKEVVAGWDEGVPGMRQGGKRKLTIPSDLGYGARGQGTIPPNAVLVFDIEVVSVTPGPPPSPSPAPSPTT